MKKLAESPRGIKITSDFRWTGERLGDTTAVVYNGLPQATEAGKSSPPSRHLNVPSEGLMPLEKELATYERELPRLLAEEGKFVLIHGEDVADTWGTYEDAIQAAYSKFGLEPFLVKRIERSEHALFFTRDLSSWISTPIQGVPSVSSDLRTPAYPGSSGA
jgi:hypothetical protein